MKYLGAISDAKDLVNKGYVDTIPAIDITQVAHANIMLATSTDRRQDAALKYDGDQLSGVLTIGSLNTRKGVLNLICKDGNTAGGGAYKASLKAEELTANRIFYLPDASGTLLCTDNLNYTTSGNNRKVQQDSSGNLYVVQKDTNTYVTQSGSTLDSWRRILGTADTADPTAPISNNTAGVYFDADGPAINTSTGEVYTKGYKMYLETSDTLYTAINNLGWTSAVIE